MQDYRSRRVSTESTHDVFSDDHELDSPVTIDNEPLSNIPQPRQQYFDDPFSDHNSSHTVPFSDNPRFSTDRSSTTKPRLMIDDVPTTSGGGLGRSISTSSRITIPRTESPYNGPTAPSHPYMMYSQLTRASSTASQSTFRPGAETPFVPPSNGPEHPYQMYPQNTVAEEDEDITTHGIPLLGFPRNGFASSSGGSSTEAGDIIGSDGHVEHLPPYTRYADNTVAKGNMDRINGRGLSQRQSRTSLAPSTLAPSTSNVPAPPSNTASTTLLVPAREEFDQEEAQEQTARKEGWKKQTLRRTHFGIPLWGMIMVVLCIVISATVGGVVGGVIGNRQGQQQAWAAGAVTTIWLDAIPTTLGADSSPLPTGHYQIPLDQSQEVNQCIPTSSYSNAWSCMDIAYIGLNVSQNNGVYQAVFEDFSANTAAFRYGPQPPDFNGTAFDLQPMSDKDAGELGVAMFFSVLFDKLAIIPESALTPASNKETTTWDVFKRSADYDGTPLIPSQKPWFCFWNSTINEVFIYLNQAAPTNSTTTTTSKDASDSKSTSHGPPTTTLFSQTTSVAAMQELTAATSPTQTATVFQAYNPAPPPRPTNAPPPPPTKRSFDTAEASISNYPKLIKMVEKRKPYDSTSPNVQPYCQQMQILDNWKIVPLLNVPKIRINEIVYTSTSTLAAAATATTNSNSQSDVISNFESYCVCEWTSH